MLRLVACFVALLVSAPTFAVVDPMVVQRVEIALADDPSDATFAPLEAAIRSGEASLEETRDLLTDLARLRAAYRFPAEAAAALMLTAEVTTRLEGANTPALGPIYATAANLFLAAGDAPAAFDAAGRALRIDRAYHDCASEAVADGYRRMAAAMVGLGRDAGEIMALAESAELRCAVSPQGRLRAVGDGDNGGVASEENFARVKVFYATDRARTGNRHPNDFYGGDRGTMDYGTMEITVPLSHKPGRVEAPSLLRLEWRENPDRHYVITRILPSDREAMLGDIRSTLAERGSDEAFVFIHGYNVTFAEAAKRTAQIAYDVNFDGAPILFSWPSRGTTFGYTHDEAVVRLSGRRLVGFLDDVVQRTGAKRINLIAHSMGNRALTDALELIAVRREAAGETAPLFEQAIFAAPDVDAELFAEVLKTIDPLARRLTLYGSRNDIALAASRTLHGMPRAGQAGEAILVTEEVDSIDMSRLGEDVLGHSYFAQSASALTDMTWLFWRDASPDQRCGMDVRTGRNGRFWLFDPVRCDGPALLSALTLIKTEGNAALARIEDILDQAQARGARDEIEEWQAIRTATASVIGR